MVKAKIGLGHPAFGGARSGQAGVLGRTIGITGREGQTMKGASWLGKQKVAKIHAAPASKSKPHKYSAKAEKSLQAGGTGGKKFEKRIAKISAGGAKQRHKPAGPGGGQFF